MKENLLDQVQQYIDKQHVTKVLVLCDALVLNLYPDYVASLSEKNSNTQFFIFPIQASEETKGINTVMQIFDFLIENQFEKSSLIINWGGGTISDIGGFVAAFFKRGVKLINIPTTLLAMVDAAHGGKNGVNFHHVKNVLGSIYFPEMVIVDNGFLKTLPEKQLLNGFAELLKTSLIGLPEIWNSISYNILNNNIINCKLWIDKAMILSIAEFKNEIVAQDPQDSGIRKILNFGHTIGHALEGFYAQKGTPISHGEAVAIGIFYEVEISLKLSFLQDAKAKEIQQVLKNLYTIPTYILNEASQIADFTLHDKKNVDGQIVCTLLKDIGNPLYNKSISHQIIVETLSTPIL